jgi:hypothetical protein
MSTNIVNQSPFLRTTRNFPQEAQPLAVEINRSYVDIAEKVNDRGIGIFPAVRPAQNGEKWYIRGNKAQGGFRQIYSFVAPGNIPHGINLANIYGLARIYGTFTDGTNWYPLPYVDINAAANQVSLVIDPTNIEINPGPGAPAITSGTVVLEWLSDI